MPGWQGSVLAGRVASAVRQPSVLLIEYGGAARNPLLREPKGFYYTLRSDRYLYCYTTQPVTARCARGVAARPGGRRQHGDQWDDVDARRPTYRGGLAERGNPGWAWGDVLPAYLAVENHSLSASAVRGGAGPLGITVTNTGDEVTCAILAAAADYGWQRVAEINAHDTERIGYTPLTVSKLRAAADERMERPGIFFIAYPIRPQTTSSLHSSGSDSTDPPVIVPRFLETDRDRRAAAPALADRP